MAKKDEVAATAEATETEATETEAKSPAHGTLAKRLVAKVAAQINTTFPEGASVVDLTVTEDVYAELVALGNEIISGATRGVPFEVKLKQINDRIQEISAGTYSPNGVRAFTAEEEKELEDLFVKRRNLVNRNKSGKSDDETPDEAE